mgnify:CR=1 FL=1
MGLPFLWNTSTFVFPTGNISAANRPGRQSISNDPPLSIILWNLMNSESSGGILIRTPNWLGDLMMSTAFILQVMELYPEYEAIWWFAAGLRNCPFHAVEGFFPLIRKPRLREVSEKI